MSEALRRQIETIVALTDEEFAIALSHFEAKNFRKHQFPVQEGNNVRHDFFIVSGLTQSFHLDETGKEHIVHFAMEDNWVTDVRAFHMQTKATLNVYCLENTVALAISFENMEKLCTQLSKMQYYFRKKATADNILLHRRIQCLISNNAANRYHDLATNSPALLQRVPKKLIASYLGVSRETLSRLTLNAV